jgi:hypothetical protein
VRLANSIDWQLFIWQKTNNQRMLTWSKWKVLHHFGTFHRLLNFYYDNQDKQLRKFLLEIMYLLVRDNMDLIWIFNQADVTNGVLDLVVDDLVRRIDSKRMVSIFVQNSDEIDSADFCRDNPNSLEPKEFWEWVSNRYWFQMKPLTKYGRLTTRGYLFTR